MQISRSLRLVLIESLESRTFLAADLAMGGSASIQILDPGETLHAKLILRNMGDTASGPFDTTLALSESGVFGDTDNIPLLTFSEPDLAAHSRLVLNRALLDVPSNTPTGRYHLVG